MIVTFAIESNGIGLLNSIYDQLDGTSPFKLIFHATDKTQHDNIGL